MAYTNLINAISAVVKTNGNGEITGQNMQDVLKSIVNTIGANATFAGIATPATVPPSTATNANVFYLASQNGTYSNFGGIVIADEVAILSNVSGAWEKISTGIANVASVDTNTADISTLKSKSYVDNINTITATLINNYTSVINIDIKRGDLLRFKVMSDTAKVTPGHIYWGIKYVGDTDEKRSIVEGDLNKEYYFSAPKDATYVRIFVDGVLASGATTINADVLSNRARIDRLENVDIPVGGTISIIGDSYSTYWGWLPSGYPSWYASHGIDGENTEQNNINSVTQTWWYILANKLKATILRNASYSGSTICTTGYDGDATTTAFVTRMKAEMGEQRALEAKPQIICVFGGTNDRWVPSPIGELKYSDWTTDDLKNVLPAMCYMFDYLKKWNPGAKIVNIVNTGLGDAITQGFRIATAHYDIINVELHDLTKENGHPNISGMAAIAQQVYNAIISQ